VRSAPSKFIEALVGFFVPPACREEVLGDLYERFTSPAKYVLDAIRTLPLVILSRIRRTVEPAIMVTQLFAWSISFLSWSSLLDLSFPSEQALIRAAIPAAMAVLALILEDAYAHPARRFGMYLARGPLLGSLVALASEEVLRIGRPDLAFPRWIGFYGSVLGLLLSASMRLRFPPIAGQLQRITAPTNWLKPVGGADGNRSRMNIKILVICALLAVIGLALVIRSNGRSTAKLSFTEFLDQVEDGQVVSATVFSHTRGATPAFGRLRDGSAVETVLPSDSGYALKVMMDHLVNVEIRDSSPSLLGLAINASPFLLLLAMWLFFMIRGVPTLRGGLR